MHQQSAAGPHLVVLAPDSYRGHRIELPQEFMVVGREPTCDVRINDPHVSRTHAALHRNGNSVYVQDLGSFGGTFVNGAAAATRELHEGDVVAFATVKARFEIAPSAAEETRSMPAQNASPRFSIGHQHAEIISNVGRDQYNSYVPPRDNFPREIAATRTKARWLVWTGFLAFVVGFALFAAGDLGFLKQVSSDIQTGSTDPPVSPFGRHIAGIPSGLLGWALAALGMMLVIVGIVLHVVAASRRKRVERELPVPPPWPGSYPEMRVR
jgi:FHA domain